MLIDDDLKRKLNTANAFLHNQTIKQDLTPDEIDKLEHVVTEGEQHPRSIKPINWKQVAENAKLSDLYDTVYRMASADGTHTTIKALLDRHAHVDSGGNQSIFQPETEGTADTLSEAVCSLLYAIAKIVDVFELEQTVKLYMDRWAKLQNIY